MNNAPKGSGVMTNPTRRQIMQIAEVVGIANYNAAALLVRLTLAEFCPAPVPVPVSERLPGPEDCDAESRCWWGAPALSSTVTGSVHHRWRLCQANDRFGSELFWLPAHALPMPQGEES